MSVINQMLKDLEARRAGSRLAPDGGPMPVIVGDRPSRRMLAAAVLLLPMVGLIAFGAGRGWWLDGEAETSPGKVGAPLASPGPGDAPGVDAGHAAEPPPQPADPVPPPISAPIEPSARVAAPLPPRSVERAVSPRPAPPLAEPPAEPPRPVRQDIDLLPPPVDPLQGVRDELQRGDSSAALGLLDAAGATTPEARALRANALQQAGRPGEAAREYAAALERQPDVAAWWVGLGITLEADAQPDAAREAYRQAGRHGAMEPALADYVDGRLRALSAPEPPR